jgi:Fructosamine kinase
VREGENNTGCVNFSQTITFRNSAHFILMHLVSFPNCLVGLLKTRRLSDSCTRKKISIGSLDIKPVILHGDLWVWKLADTMFIDFNFFIQSGNVGVDKSTGQPIIFDPASYYGHNEAE